MAMPGTEVRGPPEMEEFVTQAVVILTFENPGDRETFAAALEAENIPYGFFPDDDRRLLIFSVDMMIFVMQDAIGL
jgi:hypothetical protein